MTAYVVPLRPGTAQTLRTDVAGRSYYLRLLYAEVPGGELGWVLDLADASGKILVGGVPLLPGVDLLEQYAHLGVGARLYVYTPSAPGSPPTYVGLGRDSKLMWEYA